MGTSTRENSAGLIYDGVVHPTDHQTRERTSSPIQADLNQRSTQPDSMYVGVFENMIKIVLNSERHLFSRDEIGYFKLYDTLSYGARFVLVRLSLRKPGIWFRAHNLDQYTSELGEHILEAMDELCANAKLQLERSREVRVKVEETDVVIPKIKDGKETSKNEVEDLRVYPEAGPSDSSFESGILAENEDYATLQELLDCLTTNELAAIAKSMKVNCKGQRRGDMIKLLYNSASKQSTLAFIVPSNSSPKCKKNKSLKQTQLTFSSKGQSQLDRLRQMTMKYLQKCIRINSGVIETLQRLHLIYYRCTRHTTEFMTPSILARAKKRSYAEYQYRRTPDIWTSRQALLDYHLALIKESEIDTLLAGNGSSPGSGRGRSLTSRTPVEGDRLSALGSTAHLPPPIRAADSPMPWQEKGKGLGRHSDRVRTAALIKDIFESVYPTWKGLLTVKPDPKRKGLERFDCGHVLTQIACKGARALGVLREYDGELEVLEALLSQKQWKRAKRGGWYDRRALILMKYKSEEALHAAMAVVKEGLADPDTHTIWRPKLQRRLVNLENKLKVPSARRHICDRKLEQPKRITIIGERVYSTSDAIHLDQMGRPVEKLPPSSQLRATQYFKSTSKDRKGNDRVEVKPEKLTGKSIWKGKDNKEVSVEMFALQHYESLGYKGFHCEGRALYMIFGLLFWDIIFAPIPGAFETPYQTAPLDIGHDTFYFSRQDMIHHRLTEIKHGKAREILEVTDKKYREKGTWCVGVAWDKFERQDLLEIVDCLGSSQLKEICHVVSEDYSSRASGLPDLVIWEMSREENRCMFIEVKGPGDSLQENQKTWIDVLIRAEVPVEVCCVAEEGETPPKKRQAREVPHKRPHESDTDATLESEDDHPPITPRKRAVSSPKPSARKRRKIEPQSPLPTGVRPISPEL